MKIAILTDTNSGISSTEAEELGIFLIPMPVIIDDETFYEGQNITEEAFYQALASDKKVTTSQPSPADVLDYWDFLLQKGFDEVVYIPMSSGLSNSCHAAMGFAEDYDAKVFVVDNHRISVTLKSSVIMAKKLSDIGKSGSEIKSILEEDAYHSSIYISVNTLTYLKRGGRITPAAAMIGSVLNIKPILTIQGEKLDSFSKARSMKKCEQRMIEALLNDKEKRFADVPNEQLSIGAAGTCLSEEEQLNWKHALEEAFPGADVFYNPLSASIGCHTGPGAVGVGLSVKFL